MDFMRDNASIKSAYGSIEKIFIALAAYYFFHYTIYETVIFSDNYLWKPYIYVLSAVTVVKTILLIACESEHRKQLIALIACAIPVSLVWSLVPNYHAAVLSVLLIGCIGIDYRIMLKTHTIAVGIVVLAAMILTTGGAIDNLIFYEPARGLRSSLGFGHCNILGAFLFFTLLTAWIAWENIPNIIVLVLSASGAVFSKFVANSNTAVICFVLFSAVIVWNSVSERFCNNRIVAFLDRCVAFFATIAFPLFFVVMIGLMLAFYFRLPFADAINRFSHSRLDMPSYSLRDHGLSLFPRLYEMFGAENTYGVLDYFYLDSTYLNLFLRYGIFLSLSCAIIWPLVTFGAVRKGKKRLVLGLAMIAFYALETNTFITYVQNSILPLQFSLLYLFFIKKESGEKEEDSDGPDVLVVFCTALVVIVSALALLPNLLPWFRTLCTITRPAGEEGPFTYKLLWLIAVIGFILWSALYCYLVYLVIGSIAYKRRLSSRIIGLLVICLSVLAMVFAIGMVKIGEAEERYEKVLDEEEKAIRIVQSVDGVKLYVSDIPVMYEKRFSRISNRLFTGEDLARFSDIAVVTASNNHSVAFLGEGFSYIEISDTHCMYTDSPSVIEKLKSAGYRVENYFYRTCRIDIGKLAEANGLSLNSNGSLTVSHEAPIKSGPSIDMRDSLYELSFDISLVKAGRIDADPIAFDLIIQDFHGERIHLEKSVLVSEFDKNGNLMLRLPIRLGGIGNEFLILPRKGVAIELHSIEYEVAR